MFTGALHAQIIEFESGGLKYRTLTRGGVTIMWAHLPIHIKEYAVLQVAISNGSPVSWQVKPQDFRFERAEGGIIAALPAATVVESLMEMASRGDVVKLITAYEAALYWKFQMHSTNGYENAPAGRASRNGRRKTEGGSRYVSHCVCRQQAAARPIHRRSDFFRQRRQTTRSRKTHRQRGWRNF